MAQRFLKVKNFERYQHYKHRNPPWIKLHLDILDDSDFLAMPDASKWHYIGLLLIASRHGNDIKPDWNYIKNRLGLTETIDLSKRFLKDHVLASNASTRMLPTNLKVGDSETETETETETDYAAVPLERVVELWNTTPGLKQAEHVTGPIRDRIKARIKEHPEEAWFVDYFSRIAGSDFLTGRKTDFVATLDWAMGPKNMAKVLNGNYTNRTVPLKTIPKSMVDLL